MSDKIKMSLSFRRWPAGQTFVTMRLLVWSYNLYLELQYKPELDITVFQKTYLLPKSQTTYGKMEFKDLLHPKQY